ncbi:MAG: hypothetical protein ACLPSF_00815 [Methylocella sp.]
MPDKQDALDPLYVSVEEAARRTGESEWTVRDKLRRRVYRAKKSGRRTLIIFASVKEHLASLPDAQFARPRERRASTAGAI